MDLRIGTILLVPNALKQMPILVENGFGCFERGTGRHKVGHIGANALM